MSLKIYDRQVDYQIAYVRIDEQNSAAELMAALNDFGTEDATWTVEASHIVLSREMGSVEVPTGIVEGPNA